MKLTDLNPRWLAEDGRHGQGVTFDCPGECCASAPTMTQWQPGDPQWKRRAGVVFENPIGGGAPMPGPEAWQRTGDSFETLTLSPSVRIEPLETPPHWHGHIVNGEAISC